MVYISLTKIALLISALSCVSSKTYTGKRQVDREYYAVNIPSAEEAKYIANKLQVRFEGQVGELDHWFMLSRKQNKIEKRDSVMADFEYYKSQAIQKRDTTSPWHSVNRFDKQVLKQRTKRAPILTALNSTQILEETQKELHIKDPLFPKQWHLVTFYIVYIHVSWNEPLL
jgi:kexin